MQRELKFVGSAATAIVAGSVASVALETLLWNRATQRLVSQLMSEKTADILQTFSPLQIEGLPTPVVRYFKFALTPSQPSIQSARIEQAGQFRSGGFGMPWQPFVAVQHFSATPPGFVWDATIHMAPSIAVRVRDCYVRGEAAIEGKIASTVPIVHQRGLTTLNTSALHRYLAEAVWFPTALLPGHGVSWEAIDDGAALATLTDGATSVSLRFDFNRKGEIVGAYTPHRYRDVYGEAIPTPWETRYREYARVDGMMVPREGEASWILPEGTCVLEEGLLSYWRGRAVNIKYRFAS